ncbi:uncharacterized protein RCO7_05442 [Rhynchosporium graminicola]|uniref:Uncharacterized protein n=1 Tax=Rhynchosporium graminicola TaxID=2792576 RepID=A0A1E1KV07_9HELO|nr:uncharacterized protein RCO7_05442 [Rhynchosporium commune]
MPQESPHVMYDIQPRSGGGWLLTEKKFKGLPRLSATARGEHSKIIPQELHAPQHVPTVTLKSIGYHSLDDNKPVFATAIAGRQVSELLEAQTFSPQNMKDLGLWEKLVELQSIIVKPEMAPHLASLETTQNRKRTGTVYNITWSVEPNSKDGSIRPGIIAKKRDPEVMRMVELTTEISFALVKTADGSWTEEHERQWIKEASLTCGGGENKSITSIQVNLTAIKREDELDEDLLGEEQDISEKDEDPGHGGAASAHQHTALNDHDTAYGESEESDSIKAGEELMEETLKQKSHVHKDSHDERRNFSTILFLNHVPEDHFVGRFNITNLRLTCTCIPYSALVFTANNPHGGSGFAPYAADLSPDSPLRFKRAIGLEFPVFPADTPFTRCLTIAYSRQDCMRARTRQLNPSIWGKTALGGFINHKAQSNWMIRHAIRDCVDIGVPNPSIQDYLAKFSWVEDGKKCFEDRKLVKEALRLRGTDNTEWEIMLKLTGYNSAHIKHDHPSRYESPKQRRARLVREGLGGAAYCTALTAVGTRCIAFLAKDVGGTKMCANHWRRLVAKQKIDLADRVENDNHNGIVIDEAGVKEYNAHHMATESSHEWQAVNNAKRGKRMRNESGTSDEDEGGDIRDSFKRRLDHAVDRKRDYEEDGEVEDNEGGNFSVSSRRRLNHRKDRKLFSGGDG